MADNHMFKYLLQVQPGDRQTIEMPRGADVKHVAQDTRRWDLIALWAVVDAAAERVRRTFVILATGDPLPSGSYVGSVVSGSFAWHVVEVDE